MSLVSRSRPRTVAIVQARMGSTRLPCKALADLAGRPLLWHILDRAQRIALADTVALAIPDTAANEPLADIGRDLGAIVVRGSEANVLSRFVLAAAVSGAEIIVRICADAPLFDPEHCKGAVEALIEHDADVVRWEPADAKTAIRGAGVVSARGLSIIARHGADDPMAREHVTAWAHHHPERFEWALMMPPAWAFGDIDLSIDTQEDLDAMRAIYGQLYRPGGIVSLREALDIVRRTSCRS